MFVNIPQKVFIMMCKNMLCAQHTFLHVLLQGLTCLAHDSVLGRLKEENYRAKILGREFERLESLHERTVQISF